MESHWGDLSGRGNGHLVDVHSALERVGPLADPVPGAVEVSDTISGATDEQPPNVLDRLDVETVRADLSIRQFSDGIYLLRLRFSYKFSAQ